MADKDTPEDVEPLGEAVPLPDGPRSEGSAASRPSDTEVPTDADSGAPAYPDAPTPIAALSEAPVDAPTTPQADAAPIAVTPSEQTRPGPTLAEIAAGAVFPSPDAEHPGVSSTLSDEPQASPAPEPDWSAAVSGALAEQLPRAPEPAPLSIAPDVVPLPPAHTEVRSADIDATAFRTIPDPDPDPEPEPEPSPTLGSAPASLIEPQLPEQEAPPPAPEEPQPNAEDAAFTAAAASLFRPPETSPHEETHLVTLGRRLNPSLVIPRPVAPEIGPRDTTFDPPSPAQPTAPSSPAANWKARLRKAARYAAYAIAGYLALVLVLIVLFRFVNPPGSMLMLTQFLTGTAIDRTWAPFNTISPNLVRAVIVSEDSRFCVHGGIDTAAMREAIERAGRGTPRGASTISMQVTKNLFLWNAKSYIRKVIEIPLTLIMELVWPKQRVMEIYLNIAEWGPGVFGAEAAARHHFGKSAARLNEREAALLAAALPNPAIRVAGSPGPRTSAKARVIQARVKAYGSVASCVVSAAPRPSATPAAAAPAGAAKKPATKPQQRPAQQKKKPAPANDWQPTLQFGPN